MQVGQKNISLAVSSAMIVFVDIVSFTPWCIGQRDDDSEELVDEI
jgi:hypothetical protein